MNFKKTIKEKIENAKNSVARIRVKSDFNSYSDNLELSRLYGEIEAYQDAMTQFSVTLAYLLDTYKRALKSLKQLREPAEQKEAMKNHLMGSIATLELLLREDEII